MDLTRREVLRLLGAAGAALATGAGCHSQVSELSDAERRALAALADAVLPPDHEPGGAALGTVAYVEGLLSAFAAVVPTIFAGGPFSGRTPYADATGAPATKSPPDDFKTFIELDRMGEAAWRLHIDGSSVLVRGAPNEKLLGAVAGLRADLQRGLAAAIAASKTPLDKLAPADVSAIFDGLDADVQSLLIDLVSEAAFAAPEYGGNPGGAGWKLCHFEGDSQPLGYGQWNGTRRVERSASPLTTANPGSDPAPLDDNVRATLKLVAGVLGGRSS